MIKKNQGCYGFVWKIFLSLAFFCLVVLPRESFAAEQLRRSITIVSHRTLGAFAANAVPQTPMMEDMSEAKIAGGIYRFNLKENNANESTSCPATTCTHQIRSDDGKGISVSFTHSYGSHLGSQIIAAYVQSDGNIGAQTGEGPSGTTDSRKYSGPIEEKSLLVGAGIVLNPFSDPDGFRFPITLGLSYVNTSVDWDVPFIFTADDPIATSGQRGQDKGSISYTAFGGYGTIGPQLNTGPIRWSLVEFTAYNFGHKPDGTWTVKNLDTGATRERNGKILSGSSNVVFGFLLSATYRPWGLTLSYVPNHPGDPVASALTTYVLSWSKKW